VDAKQLLHQLVVAAQPLLQHQLAVVQLLPRLPIADAEQQLFPLQLAVAAPAELPWTLDPFRAPVQLRQLPQLPQQLQLLLQRQLRRAMPSQLLKFG